MFLKRPTDGSTSSVKARTVKLSVRIQEKTEHLSGKETYMKNSYMDLLKASTLVDLSKHRHAQIKRGTKGTPSGLVSRWTHQMFRKKGFHLNGEWGKGKNGWPVCSVRQTGVLGWKLPLTRHCMCSKAQQLAPELLGGPWRRSKKNSM